MSGAALVTGASGGIGSAAAQALAQAGRPVALHYRSNAEASDETAQRIEAAGGRALTVQADLTRDSSVDQLFDAVEERLGPVAVLVNNAGMTADNLALALSDEQWDAVMELNLRAAFRCARRALKSMVRERFGRIVNVSSAIALRANPGQANYAASKAGLLAMTRTLAVEVARRNVTVNAVAPGLVPTKLTSDVDDGLTDRIPARRAGTPEEVAAGIAFLASDAASYVTAATLTIDGGLCA